MEKATPIMRLHHRLAGAGRVAEVSWVVSGALDVDPLNKTRKILDEANITPPSAPFLSRQPEGLMCNNCL